MNHKQQPGSRPASRRFKFGFRHEDNEAVKPTADTRKLLAAVMVNGMPVTVEPLPLGQREIDLGELPVLHMKLVETAAQVSEIDPEEADRLRWAVLEEPQFAQTAIVKFIDTLAEHRPQR